MHGPTRLICSVVVASLLLVQVTDPSAVGQAPVYMNGITAAAGFSSTASSLAFRDASTLFIGDYSTWSVSLWTQDQDTGAYVIIALSLNRVVRSPGTRLRKSYYP